MPDGGGRKRPLSALFLVTYGGLIGSMVAKVGILAEVTTIIANFADSNGQHYDTTYYQSQSGNRLEAGHRGDGDHAARFPSRGSLYQRAWLGPYTRIGSGCTRCHHSDRCRRRRYDQRDCRSAAQYFYSFGYHTLRVGQRTGSPSQYPHGSCRSCRCDSLRAYRALRLWHGRWIAIFLHLQG